MVWHCYRKKAFNLHPAEASHAVCSPQSKRASSIADDSVGDQICAFCDMDGEVVLDFFHFHLSLLSDINPPPKKNKDTVQRIFFCVKFWHNVIISDVWNCNWNWTETKKHPYWFLSNMYPVDIIQRTAEKSSRCSSDYRASLCHKWLCIQGGVHVMVL